MKNSIKVVIACLLVALIAYYVGSCNSFNQVPNTKTDTVYVDREFTDTVVIHTITPPKTVTVYLKPDTVKRKAMEQATIIQGLRIEPKGVEVITIDTGGFTRVNYYPIAEGSTVLVADTGAVEVKPINKQKANLRKAGKLVIILAAFGLGLLL